MLLTAGAIVLFGVFLLSANRLMGNATITADENKFYVTALSIGQSIIDEAKTKAFDQKTIVSAIPVTDSLTVPASMGRDGFAEAVPSPDTLSSLGYASARKFNDVDDYKGYRRLVNTPRGSGYIVDVTVGYVSETCPDSSKNTRTYCKRMTVTVKSPFTTVPVDLSYPFTY